MFTSSLRRQSPALLRLTASSIRVLASSSSPKPVILHSVPSKTAVLTSSAAQRRFFAVSTYLHEANAATQEFVDSDPPAGEYHYAGHGEEHHFGDNEPVTKFQQLADRGIVDEAIINTITKGMGYEEMTKVQRKTIMETVNGDNVLAQAKTGTGKTIAFLLPVLQRILTAEKPLVTPSRSGFRSKDRASSYADIRAIIVSPTRELATQIAVDARKLSSGTNIIVQTAVGGTGKREGLRDIHKYGCHILIATPGRLLDLLTDQEGVRAPNLEIFVMDEADNLLDVGFANELDNIMAALPRRDQPIGNSGRGRQTLLFSATVPDKVMNVVMKTMGKDYKVLRMVEKGEASTHERVEQHLIRCNALENLVPATYELILREIAAINAAYEEGAEKLPFKAIVFFSATRWASLAAETFRNLRGSSEPGPDGQTGHHPLYPTKIFEIHSRLTQGQRDTAATRFRNAESAILFSSDVTARGMDFPKVTHVIQVGGPRNHEQYIHRLGRTARGTAGGVGYIVIPEIEAAQVLRELKGLPLIQDDSITTSHLDLGAEQNLPKKTADAITSITEASMRVPRELKAKTYSALIGLYSAIGNKHLMVAALNRLATLGWGMEKPPYVSPLLARKMGLDRVPGLNMVRGEDDFTSEGDQGGFRSGGFHGGRGGFGGGSRGSSRPWEGRGSQSRGSFGDRGDRPSRGGFGGPSRGGYSRDGDSGGHSDFGGRPSYGDRESSGGRGGFGGSRGRGGFGGRGGFSSGGDSGGRSSFGNRPSYGDRESSGGRGGFGGSRGRGGFSRGGSSGGFERRGDKQSDGGYRGGAGYGGRTSSHSYEGDNFGGHNKSDRNTSSSYQNSERGNYNKKVARSSFEHPLSKSNQNSESSFNGPRTGRGAPRGMSRFDD